MGPSLLQSGEESLSEELSFLAEAYRANEAAFEYGRCTYRYSIRSAATETDAVTGTWNDRVPHVYVDHTLYISGHDRAIRSEIDNDRLVAALKAHEAVLTPSNVLIHGEYALDHDALVNTAIVHPPGAERLKISFYPFNLAFDSSRSSFASLIQSSEGGVNLERQYSVEQVTRDGVAYVLVRRSAEGDSHDVHWYIDPQRGYLPMITELYRRSDGQLHGRMLILDLEEQNGAYFPLHAVYTVMRAPPEESPYCEVREMQVLELDLSYRPNEDELAVLLPKHTQYSDGVNPNTAKTLFAEKKEDFVSITTTDLPRISEQLQALAVARLQENAEIDARAKRVHSMAPSTILLLVGGNLLVLIVVGALWYGARRGWLARARK